MVYEPGEEITLNVNNCKRKFYAKAMSCREQRQYKQAQDKLIEKDLGTFETDELTELILTRLVRTDPPIELTVEGLQNVVDVAQLGTINAAILYNLTPEDKKKLE
jgi:hypothetical protein